MNHYPEFKTSQVTPYSPSEQDLRAYIAKAVSKPHKKYTDKYAVPCWNFSIIDPTIIPTENCDTPRTYLNRQMTHTNILIIDYDTSEKEGLYPKIEEVEKIFEKWEYYLYTSFNHKPEAHKFRVILPLDDNITEKELKVMCDKTHLYSFRKMLGAYDRTTFELTRIFSMPTINPERPEAYYYKIHPGPVFNLKESDLHWDISKYIYFKKADEQKAQERLEKLKKSKYEGLVKKAEYDGDDSEEGKIRYLTGLIEAAGINNRGKGNGLNNGVYSILCSAYKLFDDDWEKAKDFVMGFATHQTTIAEIKYAKEPNF